MKDMCSHSAVIRATEMLKSILKKKERGMDMKRKFTVNASSHNSNPTSQILKKGAIEYNGYYIVEDPAGDGYNIFDENFSLVDEGYGSLGSAKECIEQLVENDPERIHCATEEDEEVMYQADMANGIQDVEEEVVGGQPNLVSTKYIENIQTELTFALDEIMMGPEFGFHKDEVEQYCGVNVEEVENSTKFTVWAEVGYEGMEKIAEALNPIIEKYQEGAYFDFECPGQMSAYVDMLGDGTIVTSAQQENRCYRHVRTNREYSDYQLRHLFKFKEYHGYQGTYEEWLQEQIDSGKLVEYDCQQVNASSELFKKGDRVILDNGMTGVVRRDQTGSEEQVYVDIDGLDETKYPWPWTLRRIADIEATKWNGFSNYDDWKTSIPDYPEDGDNEEDSNNSGFWYFTRHGVQPGSIPRRAHVLDMLDTPSGTYVKLDCVLNTKELNEYDMKEQAPPSDVMSANIPNYGGAFDIESNQYFTRDEINEVGDEVCERLKPLFNSDFKLTDAFMDSKGDNNLTMEIESLATGEVFFANLQIDRRWGKNPRSMLLKAVKVLVDKFENAINQTSFELSSNVDASQETELAEVTASDETQYGVHQFSTESIIFRGTDEECGKYIDERPELWDDAEVYMMTPDDPHYVKSSVYHVRRPELKRYNEDTSEEYVETHLDAVILMSEDGSWTYEDESYPWACSEEDKEGNWYANDHSTIKIADPIDVVEKVDELLVSLLPEDPGRYHIEGSVVLTFNLSGIEYDETFRGYSEDEGNVVDREYYTDDAEVKFNAEKSSIEHFQWKMVGPGEEVDVQAQEDITAMRDIKYGIKYQMNDKSFDEICDYLYDEWQAGALTEDEYYEMQGYAQECVDARNAQQDVEAVDSLDGLAFSNWTVVDGPHATPANGYDNWTLLEKVGNGVTPRYSMYDNNIDSLDQASAYTFQLSKLSPYDSTEYVWCKYQGGTASYYRAGRRCFSESFICDESKYEEVSEWQNEVIERCLARLESFNSKLKSNIDHS